LRNHHDGEDAGVFPALLERYPEIESVVDRLKVEHERIAVLLADLQQVITDVDADPARVLADVERLTGELESHLTYEEEQLLPLL
jgi:hemerythrin-like domain-containing protein